MSNVGGHAEVLEKVLLKLRMGAMPPPGRPRPDKPTLEAFTSWLETELDAAAARDVNPGRTGSVHRLNRSEYQNAIRDLLGLDSPGRLAAAGRRCRQERLRQRGEHAVGVADAPGPLPGGRSKAQSSRAGHSAGRPRDRHLQGSDPARSERPGQRRSSVGFAGRLCRPALLSGRRRLHHQGSPAPAALRLRHGSRFAAPVGGARGRRARDVVHGRRRGDVEGAPGELCRRSLR